MPLYPTSEHLDPFDQGNLVRPLPTEIVNALPDSRRIAGKLYKKELEEFLAGRGWGVAQPTMGRWYRVGLGYVGALPDPQRDELLDLAERYDKVPGEYERKMLAGEFKPDWGPEKDRAPRAMVGSPPWPAGFVRDTFQPLAEQANIAWHLKKRFVDPFPADRRTTSQRRAEAIQKLVWGKAAPRAEFHGRLISRADLLG